MVVGRMVAVAPVALAAMVAGNKTVTTITMILAIRSKVVRYRVRSDLMGLGTRQAPLRGDSAKRASGIGYRPEKKETRQ